MAAYSDVVFYVYVLRSESDSGFYIGFSTNLRARVRQHQAGESFATKSRGPWKLVYYEAYLNQEDALGREKYLKSGSGRRFLRAQLRHYLRVKGFASRGSDHDTPEARLMSRVEAKPLLRGHARERAMTGSSLAARRAGK